MSGFDYSDVLDGDGRGEQQDGKGLRTQLETTLAENKKLAERLARLERKDTVTALLKEKGKNPATADMIPADADPKEWLDKFAALLPDVGAGADAASVQEVSKDGNVAQAQPEVKVDPALEEERQAMETLQDYTATGMPSTATADEITKLKSFEKEADLLSYIESKRGGQSEVSRGLM